MFKCPYNDLCILKLAVSFLLTVYSSFETQKIIMEEKKNRSFQRKVGNNYKVKLIL